MNIKLKSGLWLFFLPLILFGQKENTYKNKDVSWTYPDKCYFHIYDPPLKVRQDYHSQTEAINKYPEQFTIEKMHQAKKE